MEQRVFCRMKLIPLSLSENVKTKALHTIHLLHIVTVTNPSIFRLSERGLLGGSDYPSLVPVPQFSHSRQTDFCVNETSERGGFEKFEIIRTIF